jgi:hypothetical protein
MCWWPDQLSKEYRTFFCSSIHFVFQQGLISGHLDAGTGCHKEAGAARTGGGSPENELICSELTTIAEVGVRYRYSQFSAPGSRQCPSISDVKIDAKYQGARDGNPLRVAMDSSNWVSRDKTSASNSDD